MKRLILLLIIIGVVTTALSPWFYNRILSSQTRRGTSVKYKTVPHVKSDQPIEIATAVGSTGIHLLWASAGQGLNYQYRKAASGTWIRPNQLSSTEVSEVHLLSSNSALHLFWIDIEDEEVHYLKSLNNGSTWLPATTLVLPEQEGFAGKHLTGQHLSALVGNDALHVLVTAADHGRIFYLQSSDEGQHWTKPFELTSLKVYSITPGTLTLDQKGNLYAVWAEVGRRAPGETFSWGSLLCRQGLNEGRMWQEAVEIFSQESVQIEEPVVAAMGNKLLVVWNGGSGSLPADLYWQTSHDEGAHWSAPSTMTRGWPGGRQQFQSCGSASLCLLWVDKRHVQKDWWYKIPVMGDLVWGSNAALDPVWENNDLFLARSLDGTQWVGEQRLTEQLSYVHAFDTAWDSEEGLYLFWSGKKKIGKKVKDSPLPYQIFWSNLRK